MSTWNRINIGEIAELNIKSIDKSFLFDTIEYLDTGSITNGKIDSFQILPIKEAPSRAKRLVKPNDIIYSTVRPIQKHYGYIKTCKPNTVVSTGFVVISPNNKYVSSKFLYYYLTTEEVVNYLDVIAEGSTSAYPSLRPEDISNLEIDLPPINEQNQIADILSNLDDKIDLLNRQNKTLQTLAETLFRQWFIEEAEENWEKGKLEDEFTFVMGQSPSGEYINENGEGMVFYQGNADFNFRFPSIRVYTTEAKRTAKQFDTLVSVRAPVGDINMAFEECCLGRGVAAFRYKDKPSYYSYTYYKMRSLMQQVKLFEDSGTVFGSIGKDDFKNLKNTIPPQDKIDNFNFITEPIDKKIYQNELQIRTLTQLRDTLLPKLMSGEVRVEG
ncbi:MAG TPA: restriction endonuclease subunit S [Bacteroidetes bacterium]|nr:restriction endonuclease subunit S [Bacteroidota bacterium]